MTLSDRWFVRQLVGGRGSPKNLSGKISKTTTHCSDSALIFILALENLPACLVLRRLVWFLLHGPSPGPPPPSPIPHSSDAESAPGSPAVVRSSDRLLILPSAAEGYLSSPPSGSRWSVVHTAGFQQPDGPKPG